MDPDLLWDAEWFRRRTYEAFRVSPIRGIEHDLPLLEDGPRLAVVNHRWCEPLDARVAVLLVIPSEESLAKGAAVLDSTKPFREVRPVLQRAEWLSE